MAEQNYMRRMRVDNLLEKAFECPVITVTAGPGFGKTCAVYNYLKSTQIRTVWLQLSEADNQPADFWESFARAFLPFGIDVEEKFKRLELPVTRVDLIRFIELLVDEIKPRYRYAFVFDDLHLITNTSVQWFIRSLVDLVRTKSADAMELGTSLVLISRMDCGLDSVNLAAEGCLAEIGEAELQFTKSETLDLFRYMGVNVSRGLMASMDELYTETEGWAFITNIAARLLQKQKDGIKYIKNALRHNVSLVIENEFFLQNSPAMNKFLAKLSLISHLSADLISTLEDGEKLMGEVIKVSSLLRYDTYMNVYYIHHLMQDFLVKKQELLTAEERRGVYQTAAEWFLRNGYKIDAAKYFVMAQDYDALIGIIYTYPYIIPMDTAAMLIDILESAPADLKDMYPQINIHTGRLLISLGRTEEAIGELQAFADRLEAKDKTPETQKLLVGAYCTLVLAHTLICNETGDYCFLKYAKKADAYFPGSGFAPEKAMCITVLPPFVLEIGRKEKGEPEKYIEALAETVPYVSRILDGCMYGRDDLARAELAYYRANLDECKQHLMLALHKAREQDQYEIENRALFLMIRIGLAWGAYPMVRDAIEQMEAQLDNPDFANRKYRFDVAVGWFYGTIGQKEEMPDWLKSDFIAENSKTVTSSLEVFTRCKYYLIEKRYHTMLAMLSNQAGNFGAGRYLLGEIALLAHRAICLYHLHEKAAAAEALRQAYELAAPNQLDMFFIHLGNHMRTLVASVQKMPGCGIPKAWLEDIQKKSATYAKRAGQVRTQYRLQEGLDGDIRLTQKEIEVLGDLSHGLSRSEIATARGISVSTVKVVLQYIYEKLNAANSIDAVRIGFVKGLI